VSADQHAQEELAHIGRMIAELERVATEGHGEPMRHAVMRPEYWQRRIDALIVASTNEPLRRDAAALRERLAELFANAPERDTGHAGEAARETGSRK
jgi:Asp-tRNA(Asn)/Glu-tRNA(Gln) amidotransferase C subunit